MYQNTGFTLIELLVVVLIIGILSAVALPQYQKAVTKSRYVQAMTMCDNVAKGVELYKMANGTYPTALDELDITLPGMLSADKTRLSYNDYNVKLLINASASDSVLCERGALQSPQYLGFRIFFGGAGEGKRYCLAKSNDAAANFCLSLGGKNAFSNGEGLMHYEL